MSASAISIEGDTVTIELKVKLGRSMLETEEGILAALNEAECVATRETSKRGDTDGSPIVLEGVKMDLEG
jgi:hypothetical protein